MTNTLISANSAQLLIVDRCMVCLKQLTILQKVEVIETHGDVAMFLQFFYFVLMLATKQRFSARIE